MDSIEQKIYDALYSMRLAPRHQLEQAAKEVAKLFSAPPAPTMPAGIAEYIESRRKTIEASIAAEVLAGNAAKEQAERTALAELDALPDGWRKAMESLCDRMERARGILTHDNPRKDCYWGMLDTAEARTLLAAAPESAAPDRMREAEYNLRLHVFHIGQKLEGDELEEDEIAALGNELMAISEVCRNCYGEGIYGDEPDANGEGGAIYTCQSCDGSGFKQAPEREGT